MKPQETLAHLGSFIASAMFLLAIFRQYFPYEMHSHIEKLTQRAFGFVSPYIQITFSEFTGERFARSEAYTAIENYLSASSSSQAKRLKADVAQNAQNGAVVLSMDDHEEVSLDFNGVELWWKSGKKKVNNKPQSFSVYPVNDERRHYKLSFHKRHRGVVLGSYIPHVLKEGRAIRVRNRQRKLYTNSGSHWSHVVFEHPASFRTLAMDPARKAEIVDDLVAFSQAEDFYARVGRAWKRGYLLYGPPGTGKSTMVAAMANLLGYDVYDMELTAVKDNTELRKLLIETSSKSVVVIEDIDCSLDLTGQRKKRKVEEDHKDKDGNKNVSSGAVTLSGLLNFIDGLWSACGGERIIVFTTNFVDKLDPALVRRGRMDLHIEMGYCGFEAFKVLVRNYLCVEEHAMFEEVRRLMEDAKMTPADVAEHLMPRKAGAADVVEACLKRLIRGLEEAKARKAEEEENVAREEEILVEGKEKEVKE